MSQDLETTTQTTKENADPSTALPASIEAATEEATPILITDLNEIETAVESVLFASPKAVTLQKLKNLLSSFHYDTSVLKEVLASLEAKYQDRGFQLVRVSNGFQFRTHPKQSDLMQKLLEDKPARLGQSALEVLSIVAYKQPITRAEVDSVRGVDSGHLMKGLLEKDLVRTIGHAESPGRPLLYGTTPYFLEVFSLGSLDDLPSVEEFDRELQLSKLADGAASEIDASIAEAGQQNSTFNVLAAEPDRGSFDALPQETTEAADFGLQERAMEEA